MVPSSRGVSPSRDIPEEFVDVSPTPEEQRDDISPSRPAGVEDRENLPEERPEDF